MSVLSRLCENDGRLILPPVSLSTAERYGYATHIDKCVFEHTLEWLSASPDRTSHLVLCSINISGQSLTDESLLDFILERLEHYQVPAERI